MIYVVPTWSDNRYYWTQHEEVQENFCVNYLTKLLVLLSSDGLWYSVENYKCDAHTHFILSIQYSSRELYYVNFF